MPYKKEVFIHKSDFFLYNSFSITASPYSPIYHVCCSSSLSVQAEQYDIYYPACRGVLVRSAEISPRDTLHIPYPGYQLIHYTECQLICQLTLAALHKIISVYISSLSTEWSWRELGTVQINRIPILLPQPSFILFLDPSSNISSSSNLALLLPLGPTNQKPFTLLNFAQSCFFLSLKGYPVPRADHAHFSYLADIHCSYHIMSYSVEESTDPEDNA